MELKKGVLPGVVAGVLLVVLSFVGGMLMPANTEWYMEMFPEMSLSTMTLSMFLIGLFMGLVYSVVAPSVPGEGMRKGVNFGIMVWLFAGVMWPVMAMSFAPISIWLGDLVANLILYSAAGAVMVKVYK
jgi:uncharacterized membrane protein YagU involved in acid resistance